MQEGSVPQECMMTQRGMHDDPEVSSSYVYACKEIHLYTSIHAYIYIYTHAHTDTYIHILGVYIYIYVDIK